MAAFCHIIRLRLNFLHFITARLMQRVHYCTMLKGEFNPLSRNGDQQQFSPNDIHTLSRNTVMRIDKMIIKVKMHRSFIKFSQHFL